MENLAKNSNRDNESSKFLDITQDNNLDNSLIKTLLKWSTGICLSLSSCLSLKPFLIALSVFHLTFTPSVGLQKIKRSPSENLAKNSNRESESWKFSYINQNKNLDKSLIKTLLKSSTDILCLSSIKFMLIIKAFPDCSKCFSPHFHSISRSSVDLLIDSLDIQRNALLRALLGY